MRNVSDLQTVIDVAMRRRPADLAIRNVRIFDLITGELRRDDIVICGERIAAVARGYDAHREIDGSALTATPGFTDAHCHIESSLVDPVEWERMVLPLGVTSAVCDPHESANVSGRAAIDAFLAAAEAMHLRLQVQIPSCVPALPDEETGAALPADAIRSYAEGNALAEMMNVPGVLNGDPDVLQKLADFSGRPVDGHAPLAGPDVLNALCAAGITNDHECSSVSEALEKIRKGMTVFIRAGSAGRNLDALAPLLQLTLCGSVCLCTDDRTPCDVRSEGHLDAAIRKAIALGNDPLAVYRAACLTPARHFGWRDRGLIAPGYLADIVLMPDLAECRAETVIIRGREVTPELFAETPGFISDAFRGSVRLARPLTAADFPEADPAEAVIAVQDGTLITDCLPPDACGKEINRTALVERHGGSGRIGLARVTGFTLAPGCALASTVGHDSHNLCIVGSSPEAMALAGNALADCGGGFAVVKANRVLAVLPLPLAGLFSDRPWQEVAEAEAQLAAAVSETGCTLQNAFSTLAFLPLPVIPKARITLNGLRTL